MKKAVATLVLTVCLSLAACQSPSTDPTSSTPNQTPSSVSLSESEVTAQITADFVSTHPGEPAPDVAFLEKAGATSYYQANPSGLGGYILYSGAINLYSYTAGEATVKELTDLSEGGMFLGSFVTDISSDNKMALGFALFEGPQAEQIGARVTDLETGESQDYLVDNFKVGHQAGAGVFSPDNTKMAFAVTETDSSQEVTVVYLVDLTTGVMSEFKTYNGTVNLEWNDT